MRRPIGTLNSFGGQRGFDALDARRRPRRGGLAVGLLICSACRPQVSVTAGTLFDKTRNPLRSWFHVAWEITNAKQGVNALTIQRRPGAAQLSDRVVVVAQASPGDGTTRSRSTGRRGGGG